LTAEEVLEYYCNGTGTSTGTGVFSKAPTWCQGGRHIYKSQETTAITSEPGHGNVQEVSDPPAQPPPPSVNNTIDVLWTPENYRHFHDSFIRGADVGAFRMAAHQA